MKRIRNRKLAKTWQKKRKRSFSFGSLHISFLKKAPKKKILFSVFAIAIICSLIYLFLFSKTFEIKAIATKGNSSLSNEEIEGATKEILSEKSYNYILKNNFFILNNEEIKSRLSEKFTEIDSIEVKKILPDKIEIDIKEKNPALIWCRNECYFVNEEGIAFAPANEEELINSDKHFIKIIEEVKIAEETEEEEQTITEADNAGVIQEKNSEDANKSSDSSIATNDKESAPLSESTSNAILSPIAFNEAVSDKNFIAFAIDINNKISHNTKLKIKYYKTRGTKTRELIAFTDQNTKLYFDTTKSAEKQAKNLGYLLDQGLKDKQVDNIQYIYLKNEDRVFYK